jgi:hypothetical protein
MADGAIQLAGSSVSAVGMPSDSIVELRGGGTTIDGMTE